VLDAMQLIPKGRRVQILVKLPSGARFTAITLVGFTLAPVDTERKGALVVTDGKQQRCPFAGRAWRVAAHLGHRRGDGIELRRFVRIATIFVETGQRFHGSAHPSRVIRVREGERRETQSEGQRRRCKEFKNVPHDRLDAPV
jgi:hypothetical protein